VGEEGGVWEAWEVWAQCLVRVRDGKSSSEHRSKGRIPNQGGGGIAAGNGQWELRGGKSSGEDVVLTIEKFDSGRWCSPIVESCAEIRQVCPMPASS